MSSRLANFFPVNYLVSSDSSRKLKETRKKKREKLKSIEKIRARLLAEKFNAFTHFPSFQLIFHPRTCDVMHFQCENVHRIFVMWAELLRSLFPDFFSTDFSPSFSIVSINAWANNTPSWGRGAGGEWRRENWFNKLNFRWRAELWLLQISFPSSRISFSLFHLHPSCFGRSGKSSFSFRIYRYILFFHHIEKKMRRFKVCERWRCCCFYKISLNCWWFNTLHKAMNPAVLYQVEEIIWEIQIFHSKYLSRESRESWMKFIFESSRVIFMLRKIVNWAIIST